MPPSCSGRHADASPVPGLLFTDAEVDGRRVDVRTQGGLITAVALWLERRPGETLVDAAGGALLPGLHDHHIHLLALAAALHSVTLGPPTVRDNAEFDAALADARQAAATGAWIRGTGYHESVAGELTRDRLDAIVADRPVRVQHRGGALWILNSVALDAAGLDAETDPDVERDASGRLTGRLWRWDARLRETTADSPVPDLGVVARRLIGCGITGVTDATPDLDETGMALLAHAVGSGLLPLDVVLLGAPDGPALLTSLRLGPRKLLLSDHDLPGLDELVAQIASAHAARRPVAVHCVTREALLLTLAALDAAGHLEGDRIEHAAVVPTEARGILAAAGLRVVTQPSFISDRGDDYLADVDPQDLPGLYPYCSLLDAGVAVAPSSDAPFGDLDPWRTIAAAASRKTESGRVVGADERVDPRTTLAGYLSRAEDPGGAVRTVRPGEPADLCLLALPLADALEAPSAANVVLVARASRVIGDQRGPDRG